MRIALPFFLIYIFLLGACRHSEQNEEGTAIARVLDKYLYQDDIIGLVPTEASEKDSISIVKLYIENWAKKELILAKAELNLSEVESTIEQEVKDYRQSRIIYAYEKELIKQKLDTAISEKDISTYYDQNKRNFELKDYIVQAYYIKLEKNAPNIFKAKKWYKSNNEEEILSLEDYCHQYAVKFLLDENKWLYFEDLKKEMELEDVEVKDYLKQNKLLEFEDDYYLHLLRIIDYKMKDSISPLSLEKRNIRNILLNQRKLDLIKNMRNDVYQDALNRNNFEIYKD